MKAENKDNRMKSVDIVIISDSKNAELKTMMMHTLTTLYSSEKNIEFYTYIVESSAVDYSNVHKNIKMIKPKPPFGYHKYLNLGRREGTSKYVCLCNNDLDFRPGWASAIINEMEKDPELMSASPLSNKPHITNYNLNKNMGLNYGHRVKRHVAGWCIFQQRSLYDIIGDLDESFPFWYCDNDYAMDLKVRNIKHALVTNSVVNHLVSKTLNTKKNKERHELTKAQEETFRRKWKL